MNYQEIVNRIQDITNQHKMLADFGYGDLSDLKVRFENTSGDQAVQADYPYLFLNPGVHGRNQGVVTYNFNMIVMDMARGEVSDQPYNNMLAIQSQCQQYIDDVIAYLHDGFKDNPDVIYSGVTYTPFNERFQDEVSGMTATLTIEVPQPINNCIAPFEPVGLPIIYQISDTEVPGFFTEISSSVGGPTLGVDATIIDTNYLTEAGVDLDVNLLQDGTYRFKYTTTSQNLIDQSIIDATLAANPTAWTDPYGKMYLQSGWFFGETLKLWNELPLPFNTETIGTPYTLTHQFDISLPAGRYKFAFAGQPYTGQIDVVAQWSNVQYQIELVNLDPYEPVADLVLDVNSTSIHEIKPEVGDNPQPFPDVILDTYDGMRPVVANFYTITEDGTWTFIMTGTAVRNTDTANFPTGFNLNSQNGGISLEADVSNWPTDPAVGVDFDFELKWTDIPLTVANGYVAFQTKNEPPLEDQGQTFPGVNLKGYYQA